MNKQIINPILDKAAILRQEGRAELVNLEGFAKVLNQAPPAKAIKTNKFQNGAKYIPIGFIENWLDELFLGLWSFRVDPPTVVANEILVTGHLEIYHPVAKMKIVRSGAGACLIRQHKGAVLNDYNAKIPNALTMDFPHAKAEAFKNAAKSFGKRFGRDLNRDYVDTFKDRLSKSVAGQSYRFIEVTKAVKKINNIEELLTYFKTNPLWANDQDVLSLFDERKRDIQDGL